MNRNDMLWGVLRRMDTLRSEVTTRQATVDEIGALHRQVFHAQFLAEGSTLGNYREALEGLAARALKALEDYDNEQRG